MEAIGAVKSLITWGMNAEYAKIRASATNVANINRPGATFESADFASALADIQRALISGDSQRIAAAAKQPVESTAIARADVSLDTEVQKLVSAQVQYEVLSEIYQRRSEFRSVVTGGGN